MVNKYYLTKPYIIHKTPHSREGSRTQSSSILIIKRPDHTEFNEDTPVSTKGNPIMTVFVELFQVSNSIYRKFWGKKLQTEFYFFCLIIRFNAQGKFDQITGKVKKNNLLIT